ncbi:HNH endonuclease [Candidatus Protofrankia californiensis]|uniref:HNH endonuclease n=1 Tax=Candidatus Protofrankia californiensis TaxID=1839754 RepID=UPI001F497CCC|nr:HNH endonuclease [Candidatus Protofrankia californiensis]
MADIPGVLWGAVAAAADLWWHLASGQLLGWVGVVLAVGVALGLAGHVDRRIERGRFYLTRRLNGYRRHGDYVGGHEWKARRRRWLAETGKRPCHICGKPWRDGPSGVGYHAHHVDYFRAGSGHESDRDLVPICHRCHTRVHKVDRYLGPFGTRALGLSLRRCTGIVRAVHWPVRVLRGGSETVPVPAARRRPRRRPVSRRRAAAGTPPARGTVRRSRPVPDDVEHQDRPMGAGRSRTGG